MSAENQMMLKFGWRQQSDDDVVVVDVKHATPLAGMQHVHRVTSERVPVRWVPPQFVVGGEIKQKKDTNNQNVTNQLSMPIKL